MSNKITWQKTVDNHTELTVLGWVSGRCEFVVTLGTPGSSAGKPLCLARFDDGGFRSFVGAFGTLAAAKAAAKRAIPAND